MTLFSLSLISCKDNERMVYTDKAGLYFVQTNDIDSIVYSFTMTKYDIDTLNVTVKLLGQTSSEDRRFQLKINAASTAIEGKHFDPLKENYILPKNKVSVSVPIYIHKTADLDSDVFVIDLSIVEDDQFSIGYLDKSQFRLFVTNQLVRPPYWDDFFFNYFGEYSKVKHQTCIDLMGHDFPISEVGMDFQYYMRMGRKASMYFALNDVIDENGNKIEMWDPF